MTSTTPSSHIPTPTSRPDGHHPLIEGPRWYRTRIRAWGPLLGTVIPGLLGATAYAALRYSESAWSGAYGLVVGVIAAPGLLVAGAPFGERDLYPLAVLASGLMWLLVGLVASRRATRHPFATWGDFWRHYGWLAAGIWVGAGAALGIATVSIGDSLY